MKAVLLHREIASGEFTIPIVKRFTLAEIGQAHELAEKRAAGKVLLTTAGLRSHTRYS